MSAMQLRPLNIYSLLFAALLILGETLVALNTAKPFALSADDYAVALGLLTFASRPFTPARRAGLLAAWSFATGGLWVMLIYRIDPALGGTGERVVALAVALLAAGIGALWTAVSLTHQPRSPQRAL